MLESLQEDSQADYVYITRVLLALHEGRDMKVQMHNVVKWDITSKTLSSDSGDPFHMRVLVAEDSNGNQLTVDLFLEKEDELKGKR